MTAPVSSPASRSRVSARVGFGLLAAAVGVLLLHHFVLAREHVRVSRRGSHHYRTTYPLGEGVADAGIVLMTVLVAGGLLALVLAAFLGPAPSWWRRPPDGTHGPGTDALLAFAVFVAVVYLWWSLPHVTYGDPLRPGTVVELGIALACLAAAVRASSVPLSVTLWAVAGYLLTLWSEDALILLGHGAVTIALGCLLLTIFRARTGQVRALATAGLAVGVVAWLYLGFLVMFLYACEYTGGCLS
ncbi:hypothetical protein [Nocardioides antri]|uniref:Uncharacterized protein n=1 Tax=Nocardioides antri TaxID=2607659 RepID=A0A5B1M0Q3_9ACTN|nr:hypothetical protein [Nocardioides antri]KAA1426048.1 hypothetical protein F0U47_17085 [Nocardioides antri]